MNLIFDGNNTFFRNFAVNPISDINGNPVGGIIGTIRSVKWLLRDTKPSRIYFVWDAPGGSRKRRGILEEYKAGRKPRMNREVDENTTDSQKNLIWQMQKTKSFLRFLGVTQIEVQDIEADDGIAYLVGLLDPQQKVVVSSDKDFWQLVSPTTSVYWPVKKVLLTTDNFRDQTQFLPENYVIARAISGKGDVSDNIHGIKGLGDKTILKLFPFLAERPISPLDLYEFCEKHILENKWYSVILQNRELVNRNVEVMQLTTPIISAPAASVIRHAALETRPQFEFAAFKLALANNSIQITDVDLMPAFSEYRARVSNESR
jgi:5'-3' exonuclease